jgi:formylglycine-generating enzyme required for sulfatase activity
VVGISWFEAEAFARFSKKRLPTEEEWERAARGTDGRRFPWGNVFNEVLRKNTSGTLPVGKPKEDRSAAGVFNMGTNVSEWTASWFDGYPGTKFKSRYWGEKAKKRFRVARGGSWRSMSMPKAAAEYRSAATFRVFQYAHDDGYPFIGLRLAMDG